MSLKKKKCDCWGYLIPLRSNKPAIPLVYNKITVGSGGKCDVQAEQVGCPTSLFSNVDFQLIHDGSHASIKNNGPKPIYVNRVSILRDKQSVLNHLAHLAITTMDNEVLVYADKAVSDHNDINPDVTKKYVIAQTLGHGGFGRVCLVIEKKDHELYALKIVQSNTFSKREAEIARRLHHPCIVCIHKIILSPKSLFLVMDYMAGGDLSQYVNNRKLLTEQQTKLFFYQIVLAVSYLHKEGIGHRDLKPSNILLKRKEPSTLIKLADFGLSKDENIHSQMKTKAGSEPFVAPEVTDSETYTKLVDVWSMGIILFFSLSGVLPFKDVADAKCKKYQIMYHDYNLTGVSRAAIDLVGEMLKVNPNRRIKIEAILESSWLQDDGMKSEVHKLMGLPVNSPQRKISAPARSNQPTDTVHYPHRKSSVPAGTSRQAVAPRGVMQYIKSNENFQETEEKVPWWKKTLFLRKGVNK